MSPLVTGSVVPLRAGKGTVLFAGVVLAVVLIGVGAGVEGGTLGVVSEGPAAEVAKGVSVGIEIGTVPICV